MDEPSLLMVQVDRLARFLLGFRFVRRIPARLFGLGFRRERVTLAPKSP